MNKIKNIDEYQQLTAETALYPKDKGLEYTILGLVGEAGELANTYKKVIRDDGSVLNEIKRKELIGEIGDCAWYFARVCAELGVDCSEILTYNIQKLQDRKARNVISGSGNNR